jgi:hypothetical protein
MASIKETGRTNLRADLEAIQELKWKASKREESNLCDLLGDNDTSGLKVRFGDDVDKRDVTPYSLAVVKSIMLLADVNELEISSAYRGPEKQASAMFDNLKKGNRINYTEPGMKVTKVYDRAKKSVGATSNSIRSAMVNEIVRLGPENVSKHASPPDWLNVIDIKPSSIPVGKRQKFVEKVNKLVGSYVTKFLHPGNSKDPAYHIEIPQGKLLVIRDHELNHK